MALGGTYNTGSLGVTAGSTTVSGHGVLWSGAEEGDTLQVGAAIGKIDSVSGTFDGITLKDGWAGSTVPMGTATITIASPGVVTWPATAPSDGTPVLLSTTGALPTGLVAGTIYYCKSPSGSTSNLSATSGGAAINTSGTQSGVHTIGAAYRIFYDSVLRFDPALTQSKVRAFINQLETAALFGVPFEWDTGTSDADPGAGKIRANNASLTSATVLYISKTSRAGASIAAYLAGLDDSTNPTNKGLLILGEQSSGDQAIFTVGTVTDATGYIKLAISGASGVTSFISGDLINFQFTRTGDDGLVALQAAATIGQVPTSPGSSGVFVPQIPLGGISVLASASVTCNGVADDTAGIAAIIAAAPSGSKIFIPPNVTCIASNLTIAAPLVFEIGANATLKKKAATTGKLITIASSNVTITGTGTIDNNGTGSAGDGPGTEPLFANNVGSVYENIVIEGITIKGSKNYCIHFLNVSKLTIRNTKITTCERNSIAVYWGPTSIQDIKIVDNYIDRTDASYDAAAAFGGINIIGDTITAGRTASNVNLDRNRVLMRQNATSGVAIEAYHDGSSGAFPVYYRLTANGNITEKGLFGISITGAQSASATGNSISNATAYGLEFGGTRFSSAAGNSITGGQTGIAGTGDATWFSFSNSYTGNSISATTVSAIGAGQYNDQSLYVGNTIQIATGKGIIAQNSQGSVIADNVLDGISVGTIGIDLASQTATIVTNNRLYRWATAAISGVGATIQIGGNQSDTAITAEKYTINGALLSTTYNGVVYPASFTQGGIPWASATGTIASSALLAANALMIGGGTGAAPSTTATGTGVLTALGINIGSAGAPVLFNGALGSPSSAGTLPAFTLGGTVSGGSNQLNAIIIGTSTPLAGTFTAAIANSFVPNLSTVPTNGMYLPAANTLGFAINSAAKLSLTETALSPAVSDGNALGTASLMWSDLFLASGSVINWNNGDLSLTHSANLLTLTGGGLTISGKSGPAFIIRDAVDSTYVEFAVYSGATDQVQFFLQAAHLTGLAGLGSRSNHPFAFYINALEVGRIDTAGVLNMTAGYKANGVAGVDCTSAAAVTVVKGIVTACS